MAEADEVLTPAQLAKEMRVTTGYLAQQRYLGEGPAFLKLSAKAVRYRRVDIEAWKASLLRTRTDQRTATPPAGAAGSGPRSRTAVAPKSKRRSDLSARGDGDAA